MSSPQSLAPSFGFEGCCLWFYPQALPPPLSVCLSVCVFASVLPPASERATQNPAPVELLGIQPPAADGHAGLPRAAQGVGPARGASRGRGALAGNAFPERPRGAGRQIPWAPAGRPGQWGQQEGGRGAWLLDSLQWLRQGDPVEAPGGEVAGLDQVSYRTPVMAIWSTHPLP